MSASRRLRRGSRSNGAAGQRATFSVAATGTGPITYQWYKDGVSVRGATGLTSANHHVRGERDLGLFSSGDLHGGERRSPEHGHGDRPWDGGAQPSQVVDGSDAPLVGSDRYRRVLWLEAWQNCEVGFVVSGLGLEPRTNALKGRCSTN